MSTAKDIVEERRANQGFILDPRFPEGTKAMEVTPYGKPGTCVKAILWNNWGIAPCERCQRTAKFMDDRGVEFCKQNIDMLAKSLAQNARKHPDKYAKAVGYLAGKFGAKRIIKRALAMAENASMKGLTITIPYIDVELDATPPNWHPLETCEDYAAAGQYWNSKPEHPSAIQNANYCRQKAAECPPEEDES